jgi:hypothetical protein
MTPSISVTPPISPSRTPSISVTPPISPSRTPSISVTPPVSPSRTPSISVTPAVSPTRTPSATPPVSVTPAVSPTRTPSATPPVSPTPAVSSTPSSTPAPSTYTIDYDFGQYAQSGDFSITVNGSTPVYATSTTSGQITVPIDAAIGVSVSAGATSPLIAQTSLIITNAGTEIYNDVAEGTPFASDSHNYTATGNGTISASASEY